MRQSKRHNAAAVCVLGFLVLATEACSSATPQKPATPTTTGGHRTIAEGYSLVYGIASEQKELKKLLLIKRESDAVDSLMSELADYAGELCAQLEDMAERYPAVTVETQFLPVVEVKARESIKAETTDVFLASEGQDFERRLLLKQLSALESEQHTAKVMIEIETAEDRRAFWRRTEKRFGELRAKVEQLLQRQYFCD